jgi:osmotically-inducible protein OsmY
VNATDRERDAEPSEYVVGRIKDALAHDARVAALDVEVQIVGDVVVLDGEVPTHERRRVCAELARAVLQDHTVENRLLVTHQDAPSGIEDVT